MPSYAVHLAIANEIIRKNKNNIMDNEKFLLGSIAPDLEEDKLKSHDKIMLKRYIDNGFRNDYDKGYFLHIITDDEFYFEDFKNEYFKEEYGDINNCNNFYKDYDKLSTILISKYNINWYPEEIKEYMQGEVGETEYIKLDKLFAFIDKISSLNLEEKIKDLKKTKFSYKVELN